MTIKQQFINFLNENDALIPFCVNLSLDYKNKKLTLTQYLNQINPFDYLPSAFSWHFTTEKRTFWFELQLIWCSKVKKENMKYEKNL